MAHREVLLCFPVTNKDPHVLKVPTNDGLYDLKGECNVFLKKIILCLKMIHYPCTIRSHLVTIVPMAPFTPKSTSKLRSALHFRNSIVIPRFISRTNTAQS